jgi:hypothetical protein
MNPKQNTQPNGSITATKIYEKQLIPYHASELFLDSL